MNRKATQNIRAYPRAPLQRSGVSAERRKHPPIAYSKQLSHDETILLPTLFRHYPGIPRINWLRTAAARPATAAIPAAETEGTSLPYRLIQEYPRISATKNNCAIVAQFFSPSGSNFQISAFSRFTAADREFPSPYGALTRSQCPFLSGGENYLLYPRIPFCLAAPW